MLVLPSKRSGGSYRVKCHPAASQRRLYESRRRRCSPVLTTSPPVGIHVRFGIYFPYLSSPLKTSSGTKQPSTLTQEIQSLQTAITQFISTLIPLDQLDALLPEDKHTLLAAHTLAHTASLQLYRPFAQEDPAVFEKCSRSARACVSVIKHIGERDFGFLDPIIGVCSHSAYYDTGG